MKLLIYFQTSTIQRLKFGNGLVIHFTIYWACDYLSMLGLESIHVSTRGPCRFNRWTIPESRIFVFSLGRMRTMLFGMTVTLLCALGSAFAINEWMFMVSRFILALSSRFTGICSVVVGTLSTITSWHAFRINSPLCGNPLCDRWFTNKGPVIPDNAELRCLHCC